MADQITMGIGPSGGPILTTYTFQDGAVSVSARDAVVLPVPTLQSAVQRVRLFTQAVLVGGVPAIGPPAAPYVFRFLDEPGTLVTRFRSGALICDATLTLATRQTSFAARPAHILAWGDFDLFARWLDMLVVLATR